jgi:peptidyl-tRNA hydrolase, PTH1 family
MPIRCVAGLGNPGNRYKWTRHNAGFWVVDRLAHEEALEWERLDSGLETCGVIEEREVLLLKPQAYMNRSGEVVAGLLERHRIAPEELLVIVDDVAIPAGRLRMRASGSAGGHRGLKSIEDALECRDYARVRIGVMGERGEEEDLADYVLRPLDEEEKAFFKGVVTRGIEAVRMILRDGLPKAMNRFNPAASEEGERDRPAAQAGDPRSG